MGDILETASSLVMVEHAPLWQIFIWPTCCQSARVAAQLRLRIWAEVYIIADIEIEFSISIHIYEGGAGSPGLGLDAGLLGYIPEQAGVGCRVLGLSSSVPCSLFPVPCSLFPGFIMQQHAASIGAQVDVVKAIVVIVADCAA